MRQGVLLGLSDHFEHLSKDGDPLEVLEAVVNSECFRGWLVDGLSFGDGSKGGRPPFDPLSMFKALILQAQHNLSDARMEFMTRDRLPWLRFLGLDRGAPAPDENTIRHFRNRLTETSTLRRVMKASDWQLQKKGYKLNPYWSRPGRGHHGSLRGVQVDRVLRSLQDDRITVCREGQRDLPRLS